MIDLSRKVMVDKKDTPVGVLILALLPVAILFWVLVEMGLQ